MPSRNKKRVKNPDGTWSKKPVKPQIIKRKEVEDGDGWTHVIGPHQHKIHETTDTNVVHIERNLDEMSTQHEKVLKRWQESETRKIFTTEIIAFEKEVNIKIKKIVCLGLGTLQNGNFTQQNNRHAQLAALMDLVGILGGSIQLTMLAQDPAFGPCDKSFLNSLGFQVVTDPDAFEAIDGDSLVYAVHCHEEVYEIVAKMDRPAILIGNDLEDLSNSRESSVWLKPFANQYQESSSIEPVLSKRKERTDHYDQIFYSAFYATRLYLRKSPEPIKTSQNSFSEVKESTPPKAKDSLVTSEHQSVEETQPLGENLEIVRERSPEDSIPAVPKDLQDNFKIFEDQKNLYEEIDRSMQEEIISTEAAGDPAIENKENFPPTEIEPVPTDSLDHNKRGSLQVITNRYNHHSL